MYTFIFIFNIVLIMLLILSTLLFFAMNMVFFIERGLGYKYPWLAVFPVLLSGLPFAIYMWTHAGFFSPWLTGAVFIGAVLQLIFFKKTWAIMKHSYSWSRTKATLLVLGMVLFGIGSFFTTRYFDEYRWEHGEVYVVSGFAEEITTYDDYIAPDAESVIFTKTDDKFDVKTLYLVLYRDYPGKVNYLRGESPEQVIVFTTPTAGMSAKTAYVTMREIIRVEIGEVRGDPYGKKLARKEIVIDAPYKVGDTVRVYNGKIVTKP